MPPMINVRPGGSVSFSMGLSYAKSPPILAAAGAAPLPALRGAPHEVPAVRTALIVDPAEDEADAGRQPHAHHQDGVHESGSSGQLDKDVAALDDDRVTGHLDAGIVGVGAGGDVPAPGVPGAEHDLALEVAFTERAASVDAGVVERVECPLDVEERQVLALGFDHAPLPDRDVLDGCEPDSPASHAASPHAIGNSRADGRSPCRWPA